MYNNFLIHLSADGHLGCFRVLAIVNSAVMNIVGPETIKLLEEHISKTLWHKSQQDPLWPTSLSNGNKAKINKWDLIKLRFKLLNNKGNYKQGEKTAFRMGETNSKWNNWQRINLQNIKAAHAAQYQKIVTQSKNGAKN